MVSDSVSSTRKKHRDILAVQILSQIFYGAGNIVVVITTILALRKAAAE